MRELITKLKNDNNGFALTITILILIPLLIFLKISSLELTREQRAVHVTLQNAIDIAVNEAANMVDEVSQAYGQPLIDYQRAHQQFKNSLYYNIMALESGQLEEGSSFIEDVTYWLLIYNGTDKFSNMTKGNLASSVFFTNEGGTEFVSTTNEVKDFPKTIAITEYGISDTPAGEEIQVTLTNPSIVGVVRVTIKPVTEQAPQIVTRWALGEIVKIN